MRKINLSLLFCLFILTNQLLAQVTIGSGIPPNKGALLDLKEFDDDQAKEGGRTAIRGLMLPRVSLSSLTTLEPMYNYETNTPSSSDLQEHIGLTVYNVNRCAPFGAGAYFWNGEKWLGLNAKPSLPPPSAIINIDTLHIPSGMDARESLSKKMTFAWEGVPPIFTDPQSAINGSSISEGLKFTSPRGWLPTSNTWAASPATLSVWADDMLDATITSNPWATRQSKILIEIPKNECGDAFTKELYLNQTNYAIRAGSEVNPIRQIFIRDTKQIDLKVLANVPWQAFAETEEGIDMSDILESYSTEIKDAVSSDGTTGADYNFTYKGADTDIGKRYTSATLTFRDPLGKAKDYIISVVKQCQGIPDMSGVYEAASTDETSNGNVAWAEKVVRHPAKSGVYEEFYSAEFGSAGRWMVTNLAAKAYDSFSHSAGRGLTLNKNTSNENNKAYWGYPNSEGDLLSSTDYDTNPFLGYLYTWDAATGGKGGANGEQNVDKYGSSITGWVTDRSEVGMQEWLGSKDAVTRGDKQMRRQGICPKGWHLPSDYEWTELELEIIKNTNTYAEMSNIIDDGDTKVSQYTPIKGPDGTVQSGNIVVKPTYQDAWRGSTHGQAMKDICEPNFTGKSKYPNKNGASVQLTGYGLSGQSSGFGNDVMFWTSSVAHSKGAYARILNSNENRVHFYKPWRYHQFSVRCKKD